MKPGLIAAGILTALIVVGAAGFLIGESSAPTLSEAEEAEQSAFDEARALSEKQAASEAEEAGFAVGSKAGRKQGSEDGESDADAEIAASQPASTCPAGTDAFGTPPACIDRPDPGVSPEYDNCVAQGGTPSPDGCLP